MPVLTAQNATLQTVSVSIKTLTLERKQVTLAVFRQLIEEDIYDRKAGALRGVGWGHVRYLIDLPPWQGINLVWQKGGELRRCIVRRGVDPRKFKEIIERAKVARSRPYQYIKRDYGYTGWYATTINSDEDANFSPREINSPIRDQPSHEELAAASEAWDKYIADTEWATEKCEAYANCTDPLFDLPQLFIAV